MRKFVREIIISTITLLILDGIYLYSNLRVFENQVIAVQRVVLQAKPLGFVLCYLALIIGLNYFIISKNRPIFEAFLFGLVIYTVYETTNYSIFKQWKPFMVIMDSLWGGILFALTTFITYQLA
uniref:DUF2177 family protein n=1 Tax=viral metagenome TaxID=1070528 RepID=A0A6C0HCC5_9ZZZZ